jgi:hypothetical protein
MKVDIVVTVLFCTAPIAVAAQDVNDPISAERAGDCAGLYQALSGALRRNDSALADSYLDEAKKAKLCTWIVATEIAAGDSNKGYAYADKTVNARWREWFSIMNGQGFTAEVRDRAAACDELRVPCRGIIAKAEGR